MTIVDSDWDGSPAVEAVGGTEQSTGQPRDLQRTLRLLLATVWLLDAVLQLQPVMFTRGLRGFSGMLSGLAPGNPGWVAHTITWNASIVYHQPILTNAAFASVQFLIAFGIVWKRTTRYALGLSIAWAIAVWWFGEGAGGVFVGGATPLAGGPGGVLFYAVLAVVLWPSTGSDHPFVAARTVGTGTARVIWVAVWSLMALLLLVGSGRSPKALQERIANLDVGQPGWLAHIDRVSASSFLHHGTELAVLLAAIFAVVAIGVYLPLRLALMTQVLAIAVFTIIWVAVQDFGGILAGGATDPNSAPLVILFVIAYWPQVARRPSPATTPSKATIAVSGA